jgi:hypothetical protein
MYDGSELVAVASPVVVFDQRASVLVRFSESRLLYLHVTGQPRLTALLRRPSGNRDEADVGAECFKVVWTLSENNGCQKLSSLAAVFTETGLQYLLPGVAS